MGLCVLSVHLRVILLPHICVKLYYEYMEPVCPTDWLVTPAFLILCGISAVIFIGFKAKTALMSGGFAAFASLCAAYLSPYFWLPYAAVCEGIFIPFTLALFCVFAWRSAKPCSHGVFALIPEKSPELKGKGIAFLIISLMAVVSVFVTFLPDFEGHPLGLPLQYTK